MRRFFTLVAGLTLAMIPAGSQALMPIVRQIAPNTPPCPSGWAYNAQYRACFSPPPCPTCYGPPTATCVYSQYLNTKPLTVTAQEIVSGQSTCPAAPPTANSPAPHVLIYSDIRLKRDVVRIGRLDNGLQLYRFRYKWSDKVYVGVMAQDVLAVFPDAVVRGSDGYLRVDYARLGLRMQTWKEWLASKAKHSRRAA
jgi:hypothetical protein